MTPDQLLIELQGRDVRVAVADGKLTLDAPRGTLTPELIDQIRRFKADLIYRLTMPEAITLVGTTDDPPTVEFTYAAIPEWAIGQALAAFPIEVTPPTVTSCFCCHGKHWCRSIFGPHLICWTCHRPAFLNVVAEHIQP